jgi:hypothetical protein
MGGVLSVDESRRLHANGIAFNTSSPYNGTVFWSGSKADAGRCAQSIGGTISEQTQGRTVVPTVFDFVSEATDGCVSVIPDAAEARIGSFRLPENAAEMPAQ